MRISRDDPYQFVEFRPVDLSHPGKTAYTSAIVPELTAGRPSRRLVTDASKLDQYMRTFTYNDYEDKWFEMMPDYISKLNAIIASTTPASIPTAAEHRDTPLWTIRIFGTIFGGEDPFPVMGFHHLNQMSIRDCHCATYLMLAPPLRALRWTITPKSEGAGILSWSDDGIMPPGDYNWSLDGLDKMLFSTAENYWSPLKIGASQSAPSPAATGDEEGSQPAGSQPGGPAKWSLGRQLMPRALINIRDGGICRLCSLPLTYGDDGIVAHILPFRRPDGAAKHASSLDPGGYISFSQCEGVVHGATSSLINGEYFKLAITNNPSNLMLSCRSCEKTLDLLEISVNTFTTPPKRVVLLRDDTMYTENEKQALIERHKPGRPVNLSSNLSSAFDAISISTYMLSLHYHAFLCRSNRVDVEAIYALRAAAPAVSSAVAGMADLHVDLNQHDANIKDSLTKSDVGTREDGDSVDNEDSYAVHDPSPDTSLETPAPDSPDRPANSVPGSKQSGPAAGYTTFAEIRKKAPHSYDKMIDTDNWTYGVGLDI